jgi:uncharacterized coiled-coil protein SlyX
MTDRFFAAMLLGDCIHVRGIAAWGPWDPSRLHFRDEPSLDLSLKFAVADRKIRTLAELEAAITEFRQGGSLGTLWVHEQLADDLRTLWEDLLSLQDSFKQSSPQKPPR